MSTLIDYDDETDVKDSKKNQSSANYSMRGLARFGCTIFAAFLVWCTFNYPMSNTMKTWFFVWAVFAWLLG